MDKRDEPPARPSASPSERAARLSPVQSHYFRVARRLLSGERGAEQMEALVADAHRHYDHLLRHTPQHRNWAERQAYEFGAFGLALYRALRDEGVEQDAAVDLVARLVWEPVKLVGSIVSAYRYAPSPMALWKATVKLDARTYHGPPGWQYRWLGPGRDWDFGFDVTRCAYCEYFKQMAAPEVARAYCEGDNVIAERLKPAIEFRRTGTLATGGDCCDFRYRRGESRGR